MVENNNLSAVARLGVTACAEVAICRNMVVDKGLGAFGRDVANKAYNYFLQNGYLQGIDLDVADLVRQETAKDNAVINQYASEIGKGLAVASDEEKLKDAAQDERWTLSGWLSWLEPTERMWFWWNAIILEPPLDNTHFLVEVTPLDSPFMSGALKWLFKASGVVNAALEDDL